MVMRCRLLHHLSLLRLLDVNIAYNLKYLFQSFIVMIYLPYEPNIIFRRKNTAILLVQNIKKHCIAWFLTTVLTDLNLKHRETYKLRFTSSVISNFLPLFRRLGLQIIPQWSNVEKEILRDIFKINYYSGFALI